MKALNDRFKNQSGEFWANIKFISQKLGYLGKRGKLKGNDHDVIDIIEAYKESGLNTNKIYIDGKETVFGKLIVDYMAFRRISIETTVKDSLLNVKQAKALFDELRNEINPPDFLLPLNKQKGEKKDFAFFTSMINMLIWRELNGRYDCDFDPHELTSITKDNFPLRTLSRRVDGCFPSVKDPIAIWEIKEYYYTTTFGSRVADGIYESLLDGLELEEINKNFGRHIHHYLMVDDFNTWYNMGGAYLCRIIDLLYMGIIDEAIFGKEIIDRVPALVKEWKMQI